METRLSFNHCTLPAGTICAVSSVKAAVKAFTRVNKMGYVTLERVTMPSDQPKIVWVSRHNGRVKATIPVFKGDSTTSEMNVMPMEPIRAGELLRCGEYFYQTYLNREGEMGIRALTIFPDEETVRKACAMLGLNVVTVEAIKMFDTVQHKPLAGAWLIKTLGASKPYTLIYIDLRDRVTLGKVYFDNVVYETVKIDERFSANGTWYELHKDEVDRLYLTKSPVQIYHRRRRM